MLPALWKTSRGPPEHLGPLEPATIQVAPPGHISSQIELSMGIFHQGRIIAYAHGLWIRDLAYAERSLCSSSVEELRGLERVTLVSITIEMTIRL